MNIDEYVDYLKENGSEGLRAFFATYADPSPEDVFTFLSQQAFLADRKANLCARWPAMHTAGVCQLLVKERDAWRDLAKEMGRLIGTNS